MAEDITLPRALELLAYFGLDEHDEAPLARLRPIFATAVEDIVTRFCLHIRRFPESRGILADPQRLQTLERIQTEYTLSLGTFSFADPKSLVAYCAHRIQVGQAYRRIGLASRLHFGAFSRYGETLIGAAIAAGANASIPSLYKTLLFDSHVAMEAYERSQHDELVEMATTDELTKLRTRKALLAALHDELARARRFGRPLTVAFLDVDQFKQLNDSLGHATGDRVLHDVAEILRTAIRPMDIAGRYGGDEFVIGLVEAGETVARRVAERIRNRMATITDPHVTLSIGLASLQAGEDLDDLLMRADAAMYRAKARGPGQITSAGSGGSA